VRERLGKLPRWRSVSDPVLRVETELLAAPMSFSQCVRALSSSPIATSADTSQKEQTVKLPSPSPSKPSSVFSGR